MSINVRPYLQFRDGAREAMAFYQDVFGGEVAISTFAEFGFGEGAAGEKVMHSTLAVDGVTLLMAADTPEGMELPERSSVAVSLFGDAEDSAAMHAQWEKLADGATIVENLAVAPWGDEFGMLYDRFGTFWMVNIAADRSA